jgi:hypothetical protein
MYVSPLSHVLYTICLLLGLEKRLYWLLQSQNYCIKYPVLSEALETAMKPSWEV